MSPFHRMMAKTEAGPDGCILFTGAKQSKGYGTIGVGCGRSRLVHRVAWEHLRGSIPAGMTVDHLCRQRGCVNVAHMELVSATENVRRGLSPTTSASAQTHCAHGHEFTRGNTQINSRGFRQCKTCRARWERNRYARIRRERGFQYRPRAREAATN